MSDVPTNTRQVTSDNIGDRIKVNVDVSANDGTAVADKQLSKNDNNTPDTPDTTTLATMQIFDSHLAERSLDNIEEETDHKGHKVVSRSASAIVDLDNHLEVLEDHLVGEQKMKSIVWRKLMTVFKLNKRNLPRSLSDSMISQPHKARHGKRLRRFISSAQLNMKALNNVSQPRHSNPHRHCRIDGSSDAEYLDHDTWRSKEFSYRWPSTEAAQNHARTRQYEGGKTDICIDQAAMHKRLPFGMVLYFRFLITLVVLFACLSLIVLPELIFTYAGDHIDSVQATDPAFKQFEGKTTIGNLGTGRLSLSQREQCATLDVTGRTDENHLCDVANVTIGGHDFDLLTVSYMFSGIDVVVVLFFFVFTVYASSDTGRIRREIDIDQTTIGDFAVMVDGLPKEAQILDVQTHFDKLYRLDRKYKWVGNLMHAKREEVPMSADEEQFKPIKDDRFRLYNQGDAFDCTGNMFIKDSWVAEVSLAKSKGDVIKALLRNEKVLLQILRLRAKIKRFRGDAPTRESQFNESSETSLLPKDSKLIDRCEKKLKKLMVVLKSLSEYVGQGASSEYEDTVLAFVVFNHMESARRCVDDYARSASMFRRLLVPKELYFQIPKERLYTDDRFLDDREFLDSGASSNRRRNPNFGKPLAHLLDSAGEPRKYLLTVQPAPEPTTIIWENLEVKGLRRCFISTTACCMAIIVVFCGLVLIVAGKGMQTTFREKKLNPNLALCPSVQNSSSLSSLFHGTVQPNMTSGSVRRGNSEGFPDLLTLSPIWLDGSDYQQSDSISVLDQMCGQYTHTQVDDSLQENYYLDYDNWVRPATLFPVWVCKHATIICTPSINSSTGFPYFEADGMHDLDFNGVVDDGLCRWKSSDVVKSCEVDTSDNTTITVDVAGTVQRQCLEEPPRENDFARPDVTCSFDASDVDGTNGAVLRWSTLPYYPLLVAQHTSSLAEAMFPHVDGLVQKHACSSYQIQDPQPGSCEQRQPEQEHFTVGGPAWQAPWYTEECGPAGSVASWYGNVPDTQTIEQCSQYADFFSEQVRKFFELSYICHKHCEIDSVSNL